MRIRRDHVNRMDDTWLAKIARMKNQIPKATWTASKMRKLDINIAEKQAHCIKCRTWFYKKKTPLND